ncbi:vancomycin high temperature exclusion protein [Nocardiopsis mangrovi]|uniref:Vancomycin high temperature exclusion protein n=1 Tax=Nocardiopsis mangrovi TaxID=1179818 RepID=A0ABV9E8S8_9ACTN
MHVSPGTWAAAAVVAALASALAPTAWVWLASLRHRFPADSVPVRPVAIVLGAAVWESGPCPLLARRLDIAVRLYAEGRVRAVLVSGDNSARSRHETDAMTAYLVAHGVPEDAVVADPHGYRTWDTCVRARDTYGVDGATMVTQAFHLPRAVALCRAAGVDAVGVGDPSLHRRSRATVRGYAREFGANPKALLDALLRRAPLRPEPPTDTLRSVLERA